MVLENEFPMNEEKNLFIQKYMLLNTDKASTDFLLLNVLDLKWTVIGPNDQGLNDNKLDGQL